MMRGALPDEAHPGLDAAIKQMPVLYCPSSRHGIIGSVQQKNANKHNF
jgi:hypothetical protein